MSTENGCAVSKRTGSEETVSETEKPLSGWKKMWPTYVFVGITTFYFTAVTWALIVYPLLKGLGAK